MMTKAEARALLPAGVCKRCVTALRKGEYGRVCELCHCIPNERVSFTDRKQLPEGLGVLYWRTVKGWGL